MKFQVPITYEATVKLARGGQDKRRYSEVIEVVAPEVAAEVAPVALRMREGVPTVGSRGAAVVNLRVHQDRAYEQLVFRTEQGEARPIRIEDMADSQSAVLSTALKSSQSTTWIANPAQSKRVGPPKPETVVKSDRDKAVREISQFCARSLVFVEGELHVRSSLPLVMVKIDATKAWVMLKLAHHVGDDEWVNAYPVTQLAAAIDVANEKARAVGVEEVNPHETPLDAFEIVDPSLAAYDLTRKFSRAVIDKAIDLFCEILPHADKEAALTLFDLRKRRAIAGTPEESIVNPHDDLALLRLAVERLSACIDRAPFVHNSSTWRTAVIAKPLSVIETLQKFEGGLAPSRKRMTADLATQVDRLASYMAEVELSDLTL